METSVILGIIAGIIHLSGFIAYNERMFKGESRPNTATWTLWVGISSIHCANYMVMSEDWIKGILTITSTMACFVTFLLCFFKGKLSKLNFWDMIVMVVGFIALFIWWWFQSATYGNLVFQACITISFIPTYRGVWKDPMIESKLPWFVWSLAYVISTTVVFMRWQGQFQDLAFHIFGLILHFGVGIICMREIKTKNHQLI